MIRCEPPVWLEGMRNAQIAVLKAYISHRYIHHLEFIMRISFAFLLSRTSTFLPVRPPSTPSSVGTRSPPHHVVRQRRGRPDDEERRERDQKPEDGADGDRDDGRPRVGVPEERVLGPRGGAPAHLRSLVGRAESRSNRRLESIEDEEANWALHLHLHTHEILQHADFKTRLTLLHDQSTRSTLFTHFTPVHTWAREPPA